MSVLLDRPRTGYVADTVPFSNVDGPGNRFVVFFQGCNLDCIACHNPQTIPGHGPVEGFQPCHRSVDDLLIDVRRARPFISGITASGGEATQQADFVRELFSAVKSAPDLAHLTRFIDTNGACDEATWDLLAPELDGVMVDLKSLDPTIHEQMTGVRNHMVVETIGHLQDIGLLHEVRMLLVAGVNDDPELLRSSGEWLASVDPRMRIKLIGFRSHGVRPHDPPLVEPTPDQMEASASILRSCGDFDIHVI